MALSDLSVFSEFSYASMTEVLKQQVELFNEASNGAIVLSSGGNQGDYSTTAHWKKLSGLVRRRNAYGSGTVAPINLQHVESTTVKIAAGTPPINIAPSDLTYIQKSPEEYGATIGIQLAVGTFADILNTALISARAAMSTVPGINYDATTTEDKQLNLSNLNRGARLFGDNSSSISTWIMHSSPRHDLFGMAIENSNRLFQYGNVGVATDGLGRSFIMTDSPGLTTVPGGTAPIKYHTLGLVPGAIVVEQNGDMYDGFVETHGNENIQKTYQAEWTYNLGVDGFAWDKSSGGKSPTTAALASGTNWDKHASDIKDLCGVVVTTT